MKRAGLTRVSLDPVHLGPSRADEDMIRGGLWLNVISIIMIPVVLTTLVPLVFGVGL